MATTVSRTRCRIRVTVRIEFQNNTRLNATEFQQLVDNWEQSIEDIWNGSSGRQRYRGCSVLFNVVTRVGQGTDGYHQISVVAGPQRSSVASLGPDSTSGQWDEQDTGLVVAHETGHLLCLPDEYDNNGPGGSYRNLNPQPAGQPQSIMAETWGNAAPLQEHIDQVMRCVGATCPWYCRILSWIDEYLPTVLDRFKRLRLPSRFRKQTGIRERPPTSRRRERPSMKDYAIDDLFDEIRSGNPDRMSAAYDELADRGPEEIPRLRDALEDDTPLVRWAAAGALGEAGSPEMEDEGVISALSERLDDDHASVRIVAAHSLAMWGDTEGVPVLIRALEHDDVMIGHPPELTSDYAVQVLRSLSGENFGFDSSAPAYERARAVERWEEWWDEHGDEFTPRQ